jgi:16S rRNA (cytosine1407-C5)-methyltransferase
MGSCEPLLEANVPWSSQGRYLKERPSFTFDPLFHAGCYYVQEAASMFVEQAFRVAFELLDESRTSIKVLDLCAAPGGKSTLLLSLIPEDGMLVANEVVRNRASILVETIRKWGYPNAVVTHNEPSDFGKLNNLFDIMLVDAPCSGEGMFRKDPEAIQEWSPDQVKHCAVRQRDILTNSLNCLKPGGFLIYSTCTYNTDEDEAVVAWLQQVYGMEPVAIPVEDGWGISGSFHAQHPELPVSRFMPHKTKGEGFFLCLLQKPVEPYEEPLKPRNKKPPLAGMKAVPDEVRTMLLKPETYAWNATSKGQLFAIPETMSEMYERLAAHLRILHAGIMLGEMKGTSFIPHPALALSTALNTDAVSTCELDLKQAIAYLQGEALALPEACTRGWVLMRYEGQALGWAKNIGQRANNSWPAEWRIRSKNPY